MKTAATASFVAAIGAFVAVALFVLTSQVRLLYTYSLPVCGASAELRVTDPGFDPLTGLPHGRSYSCTAPGASEHLIDLGLDPSLASRWAIPLPVGFALGAASATVTLGLMRRRRHGPATPARFM